MSGAAVTLVAKGEGVHPLSGARLALQVLLVGLVCHVSTEIGFAHKLPPHNISALWATSAILFSVLVAAPVRHWWAYTLAAYFTSLINDARAGFPAASLVFIAAGLLEILIAAACVRRWAGGMRAFFGLRSLLVYLAIAFFFAPFLSAFVAALAGTAEGYWFYWRVWFLSEALAFLTLAPALLTCLATAPDAFRTASPGRWLEAGLIMALLLVVSIPVFSWPGWGESSVAVLVYLPLPLLLWAAVRFGPVGVNAALLVVACLSISGVVHGRGPFAGDTPDTDVLSLQWFLIALSIPLMLLAAVIEERRRQTNVLGESEARFRAMADTAPVMIWTSGTDRRCDYFNMKWLDFTGRRMEQELGDGWTGGVHPEDLRRCLDTYAKAFDARATFQIEYRLRRGDGEYRWVIDNGVPRFSPDGSFAGYIGSCLDIADRRQAEELRRELMHLSRAAILGELSGALAHELNQPLTAILSNAQAVQRLLAQEPVNLPEIRDTMKDIVDEDKRAGEVIRGLRALLKKGETQFRPLQLSTVIKEALDLAHAEIVARGVTVNGVLSPELPAVRADRVQLQQVLLNLIVNACDAMIGREPSERRLTIAATREGDGMLRVHLADSGAGIPTETMERLFEPFYTTKEKGLGMGLTICRSIVAAHGGRLWAFNNPERGATFCLSLPVHRAVHAGERS